MIVQPLRDLVLVALEDEAPTPSAIEVVRLDRPPTCYARVLAVGPEVRDTRVGQRVAISRLQGIVVGEQLLLPEGAVLAYFDVGASI